MKTDKILLSKNGIVVYEDNFGKLCLYHEQNEAVVLLARQGELLLLIKQFRKPVDAYVIQLPGGRVNTGEALETAVRREFAEETGYKCGAVHYLGKMLASSWRSNEVTHVFYTEVLLNSNNQQLEQHENIEVVKVAIKDCVNQIKLGTINDPELSYALLQASLQGFMQLPYEGEIL